MLALPRTREPRQPGRVLRAAPSWCAAAAAAVALVALLGWVIESRALQGWSTALPAMKVNAAFALLASAAALWLLARGRARRARRVAWTLGGAVATFGLLVLAEYLFGDLGFDRVFARDAAALHPGRPTPHTAVAFVCIGTALTAAYRETRVKILFNAAAAMTVMFAIVGYVFGADYLHGVSAKSGIAVNTLVALALLTSGIAAVEPDRGLIGMLRGEDAGARVARAVLPVATAAVLALGTLSTWMENRHDWSRAVADATFTLAVMVSLVTVVVVMARRLRRYDIGIHRLAKIVDTSADAMISIDADGVITSWNKGAERMLGYGAASIVGRNIEILVPADEQEDFRANMATIAEGRSVVGWETRRRRDDGTVIEVDLTVSPVVDDHGDVSGATAVMRDISDRLEAARRFEALLEAAPDGMVIVDADGVIVQVNAELERLFGYDRAELLGHHVEILVPPARRGAHAGMRAGYAAAPHARMMASSMLLSGCAKDGREIAIEVSLSPLDTAEGSLVIAAVRDVTARRDAEHRLAASEERFRRSFEDSGIGMAIVGLADGAPVAIEEVNTELVAITGYASDQLAAMGVFAVVHPDDLESVQDDIERLIDGEMPVLRREVRIIDAEREQRWVAIAASVVRDPDGIPLHLVAQVQDVSERKRFEGQLQHLADHDTLTGLFNRRRFEQELVRELAASRRYRWHGAVLVMDLDHFKLVNDTLGHAAGDELITITAEILKRRLRETDVLGRMGGDEFAIILPHTDAEQARRIGETLLAELREDARAAGASGVGRVTASVGIAPFGPDHLFAHAGPDDLLAQADIAMYDAKEEGRDRVAVYDATAARHERMQARVAWTNRIEQALTEDRFVLHAQPILPVTPGPGHQRAHFELLLRMIDEDGDLIPPATFLTVAERSDLSARIDRWVVRRAVAMLAEHERAGNDVAFAVNISGKSVTDPTMVDEIVAIIAASGIDPGRLTFEVTETAAIVNVARATAFAERLREIGCSFALDDFGAGFASFYYLKHLAFDFLKIDGEFIKDLTTNRTNQLVVRSVVGIARGMGKRTIAEYVGDDATLVLLREYGVDYAQGFHLGRPGELTVASVAAHHA